MGRREYLFDRLIRLPGFQRVQTFCAAHKEILLYLLFGGLSFFVSIGTYAFCNLLFGMNEHVSNVISWILAVTFAFFTNRRWVFDSGAKSPKALFLEMLHFFAGRLGTLGVEELILAVFVTWLEWNALGVKIAAQIIVILLNYIISKYFVFRSKRGEQP